VSSATPPIVLVTGGGRGIGRAIALGFAREEARVIVAARSATQIEAVAGEIDAAGGRGLALAMDVTDLSSVDAALERVLEFGGGVLDVLVNNAGAFAIQPFPELSPATWYRLIATNLNGPFHVTWRALRGLERSARAHVFNVASVAARRPFPGNTAYCASKYGLRGFSDALRLDLAERGIRVSTLYPGATDTALFDGIPGHWERTRMNRPEDVAAVVLRAYHAPAGADVSDLEVPPRDPGGFSSAG
jgi:NAD(P)-dependent dehydrogenase (short-subunit alcohol dehydrogenase family)